LLARSTAIGKKFESAAKSGKNNFRWSAKFVALVVCAIELVKNPATRNLVPAKQKACAMLRAWTGYHYRWTYGNVMRLLVPLIVSDARLAKG
jgi:hypothetical protein